MIIVTIPRQHSSFVSFSIFPPVWLHEGNFISLFYLLGYQWLYTFTTTESRKQTCSDPFKASLWRLLYCTLVAVLVLVGVGVAGLNRCAPEPAAVNGTSLPSLPHS